MFAEFFQKKLRGYDVIVETKNNIVLKGTLQFCSQSFNIELRNVQILNSADFPNLSTPKFPKLLIRGSSVSYIHLPSDYVDFDDLHDRTAYHQKMLNEGLARSNGRIKNFKID